MPWLLALASGCVLPGTAGAEDFAARCARMASHIDGDLRVTRSTLVAATPARAPGTGPQAQAAQPAHAMPGHCRIQASFERRVGVDGAPYEIKLELRIPEAWEGRLLFQGGGGMNGSVPPATGGNFNDRSAYPPALARRFAVVSTDTGHVAAHGADASFARDQQAKLNYAYAAIGKVAERAKRLTAAFAGAAPRYSYFAGCSNGGREGLLMAQRHPELFDGILAANPAFNLRDAAVLSYFSGATYDRAARADPAAAGTAARLVTPAEGELIRGALLAQCDGLDGLRDGMIFDQGACRFDVRALACKPGAAGAPCLAPEKAEAIATAFRGPLDAGGKPRFSPWVWDASVFMPEWSVWQTGVMQADGKPMTGLRELVTNSLTGYFAFPPIDRRTLGGGDSDIDADIARLLRATDDTAGLTGATSTNLSTFAQRGAKLMISSGWSDPIFSGHDLVAWYARMADDMQQVRKHPTRDFARLFMAPGVAHCAGGRGLDDMDSLGALVDWVEKDRAPEFLLARGHAFPGVSRPICAWPKVARYSGAGPAAHAASMRCAPSTTPDQAANPPKDSP